MPKKLACVILAAGKGTRMKSDISKPLHKVVGRSMVGHVIDTATKLNPDEIIVVIGSDMADMREEVAPHKIVIQEVANGTGGAVIPAKKYLENFNGNIIVLFGDTPLITEDSIEKLLQVMNKSDNTALVYSAMLLDNPKKYGRMIVKNDDILDKIVEFKDASKKEKKINLCNGGIMCADGKYLFDWLGELDCDNSQGEYYLTDLPKIAKKYGKITKIAQIDAEDMEGVNSREDLARVENIFQNRLRRYAMQNGVTLQDPNTVYFSYDTKIAKDTTVGANVVFGTGVEIASNVTILPFSHLEECKIKAGASIGPFARIRPQSEIGENAKIGNFVEIKKTTLGRGAKASHLTYLGDTEVGEGSNIGAGTITCNYDGFLKYKTKIGKRAFIGSNSSLVAPVNIADGAYVGAGSVITVDVPENSLSVTRAKNIIRKNWAENFRKIKQAEKLKKAS